ncbi:MAG: DUF4258 domain-containing protein [Candidatus Diapherotrites archaeon]
MRIRYEKHAEEQLRERGLDKELIEQTLLAPEQILDSRKNRKIAQKLFIIGRFKFLVRVIYVIESGGFVVISAYRTTRIWKYEIKGDGR